MWRRCFKSRRARLTVGLGVLLVAGAAYWMPPVRSQRLLDRAKQMLDERKTEEAIAILEEVKRLEPKSSRAEFLLARAARRQGRWRDVEQHLAHAKQFGYDPEFIRREQWLAMAQAGRIHEVTEHLADLISDPRGDGPYICEAYVEGFFATYRFDLGLPLLDAWAADFPDDSQPHVYYGAYYEHFDHWPEAAAAYRRAMELAPERTDVALRLGELLIRMHEFEEAEECFRRCLAQSPNDPGVRCEWARCLAARGDTAAARAEIQQVLQSHDDFDDARLALAEIERTDGDDERALPLLESYCEAHPTDVESRYLFAQVLQALDRQQEAAAHFEFVAAAREAMSEVRALLDQVRQHPEDAEARCQIGIRLLKYDIPEHGVEWLRSAVDIRPDHVAAHAGLADYYSRVGLHELAEYHRRFTEHMDSGTAAGPSFSDGR